MLTVLTIAVVIIAFVLTVAHWKKVRESLLWMSAFIIILSILASVIAFIVAIVTWQIAPALVGLALLFVSGFLAAIEDWDRNKQIAEWRASLLKRDDSEIPPDEN